MQDSLANGVRRSYRLSGNDGPAVVLIHGLGGSAEATYHSAIERLSHQNAGVFADLVVDFLRKTAGAAQR